MKNFPAELVTNAIWRFLIPDNTALAPTRSSFSNLLLVIDMKTILCFTLLITAQLSFAQSYSFQVAVTRKGQPILLTLGYSYSGAVWDETVAHLRDRYEYHTLILPGYAGVASIRQPILKTVWDKILQYVRDKKLDKPVLIGYSLGAFMSLWVSSQAPGIAGKLVCMDGVSFISSMMNSAIMADSLRKSPMYSTETVAQNFVNLPTAPYETNMVKSMITQTSDTSLARRIAHWSALADRKTLGYTLVETSKTNLRQAIAAIKSPNLALGSIYMNSKETSERILTEEYEHPSRKTIAVANTKHFIMYDDPAWFYTKLDNFLQAAR